MAKVLQVVCSFYPRIGGIEQVAKDISDVLKTNDKIEQKIICLNEDAKIGEYECHRKETVHDTVNGVDVIRCGCITKAASQLISLTYPSEISKLLKEFDPDVVIFHYPNPYLAMFLLPKLKKHTKLVLYWHLDITKQKILGKLFNRQNIRLLERADKIVATSPDYINGSKYLSRFKEKCTVIPNCINPNKIAVSENTDKFADKIRDENKDKIICFGIGRHVPYKGYSYLIEAAKYLDDRFKIFIGGSGPLTESLKSEAKELKNVAFVGRISDEELVGYLTACDIFCFPSITKNEAFGIALAEGMYFGKPAVTFTIPGSGVNYVNLNGETGIECPNCDSKAYAEALKKLADDPELRKQLGDNARKRVTENFTFEIFKGNINKLVNNLTEGQK